MIWEGGREDWESAAPRPVWVWVKDAVGLVLAMVCAVVFPLLLWSIL